MFRIMGLLGEDEEGGVMQTVALETGRELHGDPLLIQGPDPVKFQGGGRGCLIEKSLLHFLLRLLSCIHSRKSQLPSLLGYFGSAFLHAGIQLQPGRNGALCCCWWPGLQARWLSSEAPGQPPGLL